MLQVKLSEIIDGREALTRLVASPTPAWLALRLSRVMRDVQPVLARYDDYLAGKYKEIGVEDKEDPGVWKIPPNKRAEYQKWYAEMVGETVEVGVSKITAADIETRAPGLLISAFDIFVLAWLIDQTETAG